MKLNNLPNDLLSKFINNAEFELRTSQKSGKKFVSLKKGHEIIYSYLILYGDNNVADDSDKSTDSSESVDL